MTSLREDLTSYLGYVNEIRQGLIVKNVPQKPELLTWYEQCKLTGLPLVDGGVMDQPHIWLKAYRICDELVSVYEELAKMNEQSEG